MRPKQFRFLPDSTVLHPRVVFGGWCSEWDMKVHGKVHIRAGSQPTKAVLQHIVCRVMWNELREAAERQGAENRYKSIRGGGI